MAVSKNLPKVPQASVPAKKWERESEAESGHLDNNPLLWLLFSTGSYFFSPKQRQVRVFLLSVFVIFYPELISVKVNEAVIVLKSPQFVFIMLTNLKQTCSPGTLVNKYESKSKKYKMCLIYSHMLGRLGWSWEVTLVYSPKNYISSFTFPPTRARFGGATVSTCQQLFFLYVYHLITGLAALMRYSLKCWIGVKLSSLSSLLFAEVNWR